MTLTATAATSAATVVLTREGAESLTEEIRKAGSNVVTARKALAKVIKRAKDEGAADVLGFASWTAYVAHVFSAESMPRMAKADLEYLAAFMAGEGMSSRAVAAVLGVSQATASRMIRACRPEGEETYDVTGADGKTYTMSAKVKPAKGAAKGDAEGEGEGEGSGESTPAKGDPRQAALSKIRKGAETLVETLPEDLTALTVEDIDALLLDLKAATENVRRYADTLAKTRKTAPVAE